jgi:hypothetical protein
MITVKGDIDGDATFEQQINYGTKRTGIFLTSESVKA